MATDIIARGMAAGSIKPGSDGKIPSEYLPSYIDDVVDLIAVTDTAPATCAEGDKYYNTTDKLIYTAVATNTWGTTGETPEDGKIYLNISTNPAESYRWSGTELVIIGQDLSDYYTKEDTDALLNSLQTIFVHNSSYGASASNPIIFSDLKPGIHVLQVNRDGLIYAKASPSHAVDSGYSLANMVDTKIYVIKTYKSGLPNQTTLAYIYQHYSGGNERIQFNIIKTNDNSTSGLSVFPGETLNTSIGWHTGYQNEHFYKGASFYNNVYPVMYNMSTMPTQNNQFVPKQYVDGLVPQVATLPTAASTNEGRIYQFTGTTDANYTNGYFYKCVSDGAASPTYSWERIDIQPGSIADFDLFVLDHTQYPNSTVYLKGLKKGIYCWDNGVSYFTFKWDAETGQHPGLSNITTVNGYFIVLMDINEDIASNTTIVLCGETKGTRTSPLERNKKYNTIIRKDDGQYKISGNNTQISRDVSAEPVDQTIYGVKTFETLPESSVTPTTNNQLVNKAYVDDSILVKTYELSGLSAYSNAATYAVDDYVYYNNLIYKCNTAVATPEDFDSQKWTQKTYIEYMTDIIIGSALTQNY